jgi:Na+:H+ antiporter, NhaA family
MPAPASRITPWSPASGRALRTFLHTEAGSSALLLAATVVALVWANSPLGDAYVELWSTELAVTVGSEGITEDLRHWVNDGLMVFFFYVVGLEIRRELAMGELTDRRTAAIPAIAALAGMVVPAGIFLALNPTGEEARGWGVVMATDIAFVLGALAVFGRKAPPEVRAFLLTLAIVDDIGAITVIAIFYSDAIDLVALGIAAGLLAAFGVVRHARAWRGPVLFAVGLAVWVAMHESGVHPTIAGVLLGLLTQVHPPRREDVERAASATRSLRQAPTPAHARQAMLSVGDAVSANERLTEALHPWTSYVIVPVFALANAGVVLDAEVLSDAAGSTLVLGIVLGLVAGKTLGVGLASAAALRLRAGDLPGTMEPVHLPAAGALAGIGFTVSLFVVDLAFDSEALREQAKVGVLAASLLAAAIGAGLFALAARRAGAAEHRLPTRLDPPVDPRIDHDLGPTDAPLELVQFVDYQCEFCAEATGVVDDLRERFGDRLRYVVRHLPNEARHPRSRLAAEAAEAAAAQGQDLFWPFHQRLFDERRFEPDDLLGHAQAVGLDVERFAEDLEARVHAAQVDADVAGARRSGVRGTPAFFVNGVRHDGAWDAATLGAALEAAGDRGPTSAGAAR